MKEEKPKSNPDFYTLQPDTVYTTPSLAMALGVTEYTVRKAVKDGRLKARKQFGRFYFLGAEVIEALAKGTPYNDPGDWIRE